MGVNADEPLQLYALPRFFRKSPPSGPGVREAEQRPTRNGTSPAPDSPEPPTPPLSYATVSLFRSSQGSTAKRGTSEAEPPLGAAPL